MNDQLLRDFLERDFLAQKIADGTISVNTAAWVRSCFNRLQQCAGRELLCIDVDRALVDKFEAWLLRRNCNKNTAKEYVKRVHAVIGQFNPRQLGPHCTERGNRTRPRRGAIPKYKVHYNRGIKYAAATINGHTHYLGRYDTPESLQRYHRLIAEYLASGKSPVFGLPAESLTVESVVKSYLQFAREYYGGEGRTEFDNMNAAVKAILVLYSDFPAKDFGPQQLKAVRQSLVDAGHSRKGINARIKRILRVFRWAVSEGMIEIAVPATLATVDGLRKGRTTAHDTPPVLPADPALVDATLPHLHPILQAMVTLQRLTGARPGEVCIMRPCDINRSDDVWLYRPSSHKNTNRGKERVIPIGPRGREILRPYLVRAADSFCFSAKRVSDDNQKNALATRPARKTPLYPCELKRVKRQAAARRRRRIKERRPAERYTTNSYSNAIRRACIRAFGVDGQRWAPNQLRHLKATEVRKQFGLDSAQIILGHAQADVTQIYAERDSGLAIRIAKEVG